jgi:hypothetical protein
LSIFANHSSNGNNIIFPDKGAFMKFTKKTFFILTIVAILASTTFASDEWATDAGSAYAKGSKMVNIGVAGYPYGFTGAFEYGFHQAISGSIYSGYLIEPFWDYGTYNTIPLFVRAAFHPFNLKVISDKISVRNKLDTYVGLSTGALFGFWSDKDNAYDKPDEYSRFQLREYIGVRYYMNEKFSFFAEDCGGFPYFNIGVSFKL